MGSNSVLLYVHGESSDSVDSVWFNVAVAMYSSMRRKTGKQQALWTTNVFFGCKKRDGQQKEKEAKKRTDKKDLMSKKC